MIGIPRHIMDDIINHAFEKAPIEACGLLAGIGSEAKRSYRLTNVDASSEHFSLDPKEHFAAIKDARPLGFEILAVYHSHPATPARMSEEDLRLAVAPGFRYVIISLVDPDNPYLRSFTVEDGIPKEEEVIIRNPGNE